MKLKTLTNLALAFAMLAPAPVAMTAEAKTKSKKRTTASRSKKYSRYKGTVGKYKVTMFLDDNYNGYYYYGNGSKGKLTLKGRPTNEPCGAACMGLYLYEYDSKGNCTATWDVALNGMTVSPGQRVWGVFGEMTTGNNTYEVELWAE